MSRDENPGPTRAGTPECTVQVVCAAADRVGQPAAPVPLPRDISGDTAGAIAYACLQPAAPSRTEAETMSDDERECLLSLAGIETGDGVAEKALRIIDVECQQCIRHGQRTESEQAVLLAMRGASEPSLRGYAESTKADWLGDACRAELARRGLK